jgi:ribose/xylose/arabinose/galactoside ABC-type transport system permease subunit
MEPDLKETSSQPSERPPAAASPSPPRASVLQSWGKALVPARRGIAGRSVVGALQRLSGLAIAIVVVGAIFSYLQPAFLSASVIVSLLRGMSSLAIVALGLTLVIIVGEIDLSFGAVYGLVANLLAVLWLVHGVSLYLSLAIALGVSVIIGLFNGLMVTKLKMPSFIVTLGSYNLIYGFTLYFGKSASFSTSSPSSPHVSAGQVHFFAALTASNLPDGLSVEVLWMVGIAIVVGFILHRSLFGFRLRAIGGNEVAARVARLAVGRYKVLAFVIAAVLAGVAGLLDFSYIGSVEPDAGLTLTFTVFAAVIIGGASLSGGRGTVIGTMGGALLLSALSTGLALITASPFAQQLFLGIVTIAAVALDIFTARRNKARA